MINDRSFESCLPDLKNETLQIIAFEGFFNLNNLNPSRYKNHCFQFEYVREVRIQSGSQKRAMLSAKSLIRFQVGKTAFEICLIIFS
jgi:hypothetical protein